MTYREFVFSLKAGPPQRVYVFCGPEAFLRKDALARLRVKLLPPGLEGLNYTELVNPDVRAITESAETLPFLCERRVVVVRELSLLEQDPGKTAAKKKGEAKQKESAGGEAEELLRWLERVPETVCLVFDAGDGMDRRRKLGKALSALPGWVSFDPLGDRDLISFLQKCAKRAGTEMGRQAAERLIFLSGRDMNALSLEMDKLAAYCAGQERIEVPDVDRLATRTAEARVFDMIDALMEGKLDVAYRQLSVLLESGESRLGILALITRQVRQMLFARDMGDAGKTQQEIAAALGIKPFVVGKVRNRMRGVTTEGLKRRLQSCEETEFAIKSGAKREDAALDLLLMDLQAARAV